MHAHILTLTDTQTQFSGVTDACSHSECDFLDTRFRLQLSPLLSLCVYGNSKQLNVPAQVCACERVCEGSFIQKRLPMFFRLVLVPTFITCSDGAAVCAHTTHTRKQMCTDKPVRNTHNIIMPLCSLKWGKIHIYSLTYEKSHTNIYTQIRHACPPAIKNPNTGNLRTHTLREI